MPKLKSVFVCQNCSYESPAWTGQCPECKSWNSFVETISKAPISSRGSGERKASVEITRLKDVKISSSFRVASGISEFDRVLGGGFVPGQVILLAGDPGVGKSTLLLHISDRLGKDVVYVAGEESPEQIKLRAERLGIKSGNLYVLSETDVDSVISSIDAPGLIIVDSIQTMTTTDLTGTAGSVGQVRESAGRLSAMAKAKGIPMVLVGHVTKEGSIAGPKVLEHLVDTVLYIEGDEHHFFRLLRTTKNRFGPVSEVGIFEMREEGLSEVTNPSDIFLEERLKSAPGSCVTVVMEGFRPILLEVQALATTTAFGYPKRTASGFNVNRLAVLIAVLEKRCGIKLSSQDIYVNVAGGMKLFEYSSDLAVCLAIASSYYSKPLNPKLVSFGEVGLSGEIRKVSHMEKRSKEARKLGFTKIIGPDDVQSLEAAIKASLK